MPRFNTTEIIGPNPGSQFAIQNAIPGLSGLTSGATSIINSALSGLPSPDESRLANAYFGAGSGLDPTSDFLRNRGYDLYKRNAEARKRGGIQDLLSLVGTYSGAVAPTPGQELSDRTQNKSIDTQNSQFQQNFGFEQQQWQKQLQLLNQMLNPAGGTGNSPLAPNQNANPTTSTGPYNYSWPGIY